MTEEEFKKGTEIQIKLDEVKWALEEISSKECPGISYWDGEKLNAYLLLTFKHDEPFIYSGLIKLLEDYKEYLEKKFAAL